MTIGSAQLPMLETLLKLLSWDFLPAPEILLEENGDLNLDWSFPCGNLSYASISINKDGGVAWAMQSKGDSIHGDDLEEFKRIVEKLTAP